MKKDAFYFSHDSNARNDIKMLRLRRSLGLEGYAIYFCLIEMLREQIDYKLPIETIQDIAYELHTSDDKIKAVVYNSDLFEIHEEVFFSARLLRSMEEYNSRKIKYIEAGRKGGFSKAIASLQHPSTIKGKKRKEKN